MTYHMTANATQMWTLLSCTTVWIQALFRYRQTYSGRLKSSTWKSAALHWKMNKCFKMWNWIKVLDLTTFQTYPSCDDQRLFFLLTVIVSGQHAKRSNLHRYFWKVQIPRTRKRSRGTFYLLLLTAVTCMCYFKLFRDPFLPFFRLSLIMIVLCSRFLPLSWCYLQYLCPPWFLSTYNILHSAFIILYCLEHTVLLCLFFPFFSTVLSDGSGESLMRSNSGWAGQPLDIETSIFSPCHALTPFLLGHQRF